jgi:hypothetical protein
VGDASSLHRAFGQATSGASKLGSALGHVAKAGAYAAGAAGLGAVYFTLRAGFADWEKNITVAAQTEAVLKSTGGVAKVTAKNVQDLATTIEHYSGVDDEAVKAGENVLLSFVHIRNEAGKNNDIFTQATKVVTDFAVRTGRDVPQAALLLGKALEDPVHKVSSLARAGVVFTDSQKKMITKLVESGHTLEAQKLILSELEKRYGGAAKAAGKTLPGQLEILKQRFDDFAGDLVGKAIPALVSFGTKVADAKGFKAKLEVVWTGLTETAQKLVNAIQAEMDKVDWSSVGRSVVAGIRQGLSKAAEIAGQLNAILQQTLQQVNWEQVGTTIGPLVAAAVVSGLAVILSPEFWLRHWQEMAAIALALFPISKFAGIGGKLVAGLVKPVSETLGPLLRAAMTRAGDLVLSVAARLPARLGSVFLEAVLLAGRTFARLPGAIGGAIGNLGSFVAGKLGSFKSFVIKALAFDVIIHAVVQSVGRLVTSIIDAFQRLWAWLKGAAPGIARSAGVAIGNALTSGVLSGVAGLASRVAGVVQGALSHLPHLDIPGGSPIPHVGFKIGKSLGDGIILGFLDGTAELPAKVSDKIKKALEAGKKVVEGYRTQFENVFGRMLDLALRAFDAKTQKKLDQFAARASAATPAEAALSGIDERRAAEDRARAIQDAQRQLSEAQASGDPQAILDAQRNLDRAVEDEQIASLQRQAIAERTAQEATIAEEQKNYEFRREQQRLHLEAQIAGLEKGLESGHLTYKQFHAKLMKLLKANGIDYKDAGELLGSAFAAGLTNSINKVTQAALRLVKALEKILKLHSPAEVGPLSDLDTWWTALPDMLAGQLKTAKVSAAAGRLAGALQGPLAGDLSGSLPLAGAASTAGGRASVVEQHFHYHGTFIGGDKERLARELRDATVTMGQRSGGGMYAGQA